MIYLESTSTDPYYNLALEEYVFEKLDNTRSYFMLWQNRNTIVVGKYQNTAEEINQKAVEANNTLVARRLSGGGAVYHDMGNLNFTFIVDQNDVADFNFQVFVKPVVRALEKIGVHGEFTGRNDITIDGMKISGNSQYVKHGRVMHHGCIMLDSNIAAVSEMLTPSKAKFTSKTAKSVKSRVTTINSHTKVPVTMSEFKELLKSEISLTEPLEPITLSPLQLDEIMKLRNEKYATWEWNYGKSADYNMHNEKKFPAGLVSVYLQVKDGRMNDVRLYGDFFGNRDISELEEALRGLSLDTDLKSRLELIDIGQYINGLSADELYELLMY